MSLLKFFFDKFIYSLHKSIKHWNFHLQPPHLRENANKWHVAATAHERYKADKMATNNTKKKSWNCNSDKTQSKYKE